MIRRRIRGKQHARMISQSLILLIVAVLGPHNFSSHLPADAFSSPHFLVQRTGTVRESSSTTALYGIRGFVGWFDKQFQDAIVDIHIRKPKDSSNVGNRLTSSTIPFDHVLVDLNQILHIVSRRSKTPDQAVRFLLRELDRLVAVLPPRKSLVLAMDGPAAVAKLATQRKRRYGIVQRTHWKLRHFEKLRGKTQKERAKKLRSYHSDLESLQITPGTEFMDRMEDAIIYWAWQRMEQGKLQIKVHVSGSQIAGEGEIKLLEWILQRPRKEETIAIVGGDSDLLLEGLLVPPQWAHNIFVVRDHTSKLSLVSLWEVTRKIYQEWLPPESATPERLMQCRADFMLLMILSGNDYLPNLRGARDFSKVCRIYRQVMREHPGGLVDPERLEFQLDFCIAFLEAFGGPTDEWGRKEEDEFDGTTPFSQVHSLSEAGFLPSPVKFQLCSLDSKQDVDSDDDDDDDDDDDRVSESEDGEEPVVLRFTLGNPEKDDDYMEYEIPYSRNQSLKYGKQQLAMMALDGFLGTDFVQSGEDIFSADTGIGHSGYEWEINVPADGNVTEYLAGLLWNLQTYQDGICADYLYNYGRRTSLNPSDILDFFQQAKSDGRSVGRKDLLGNEFGKPYSAGLSCLAALPSEVRDFIPEPYQWIDGELVESYYSNSMDPTTNVFDAKKFEALCEAEIDRIGSKRMNDPQKSVSTQGPHGRRILSGDHFWTVIGLSNEPMKHPFDPPKPPAEKLGRLRPNRNIRVSRVLALEAPRPRHAWGDKIPSESTTHKRANGHFPHFDVQRSSVGDLLDGHASILNVEYVRLSRPVNGRKKNVSMQHPERPKPIVKQAPKVDAEPVSPLPPYPKNKDETSPLQLLSNLKDARVIDFIKFNSESPSPSPLVAHNRDSYELLQLAMGPSNAESMKESNFMPTTMTWEIDRHKLKQSKSLVKQHLAAMALDQIVGPVANWKELKWPELLDVLSAEPIERNGKRKTTVDRKAFIKSRIKEFSMEPPPKGSSDRSKDGKTALVCLRQLLDDGYLEMMEFSYELPSESDFASFDPSSHENVRLVIRERDDTKNELTFEQDRDVHGQSRQILKQHLASLALRTIVSESWTNMTLTEIRKIIKNRMTELLVETLPINSSDRSKDGETALACLRQLGDAGLLEKIEFSNQPFGPSGHEIVRLVIRERDDNKKELTLELDRKVNGPSRQILKQHLASLALRTIVGESWMKMTCKEMRETLEQKVRLQ